MLEMVRQQHPATLDRVVAIVDVDGESIGIVLARPVRGMPLAILGEKRMRMPYSERSSEHSMMRLAELLERASQELLTQLRTASFVVDTAYVVLRMPWVSTRLARRAVYTGKEVPVTRDFINNVAMSAISNDIVPTQENFLEGRVMRVELNGYATNNPLGKRASTVDLMLLASESPARERDILRAAISRVFPVATLQWRSGTRAMVHAMRSRTPEPKEYLFVDMGYESSIVGLVRDGVLAGHEVVPYGVRSLLGAESGEGSDILSALRSHGANHHAPAVEKKIHAHIARTGEEALSAFLPALSTLSHDYRLPNQVRALAPREVHAWLGHVLARPECSTLTQNAQSLQVIPINASSFASALHSSDAVRDPSLAVACALVHNECDNG